MTSYLIVSGVTLLVALILAAIIYLLFVSHTLSRTCKNLISIIDSHKSEYDTDVSNIYRDMDDKEAAVRKDFEDVQRDNQQAVVEIYRDMENHVNNLMTEVEKSRSELNIKIDTTSSYVDSRLDWLVNKMEKEYVQKTSLTVK